MKRLLLTGFAPSDSFPENPSATIAASLDGLTVGHWSVASKLIDAASLEALRDTIYDLIEVVEPDAVVSLGIAPGDSTIRLERVALNFPSVEFTDSPPIDVDRPRLDQDGPLAIESRLPVSAIQAELLRHGIPSRISHTAGIFSCNATMYYFLRFTDETIPSGFIHVPYTRDRIASILRDSSPTPGALYSALSSMELTTMESAVQLALKVIE